MNVLLNATLEEMQTLGGDVTLNRDWLRLGRLAGPDVTVVPAPPSSRRSLSLFARLALEKLTRKREPDLVRRSMLLASRYVYVPPAALNHVDVVFSHLLYPALGRERRPIVWSSQGISPAVYYERYNGKQWGIEDVVSAYRSLGEKSAILAISTESCARNVVERCPELRSKVRVLPAPVFVDEQPTTGKPSAVDGALRLLFVGMDARRKGLAEVLEAFRMFRAKHAEARLAVVSRPSPEQRRQLDTMPGASLHESSPDLDVARMMREADIFLMPTHADTYGLAAVEAMAHGCAVIVSDLQPLPEIVPGGRAGFHVPVGRADAILDRLDDVASSQSLLRQLQDGARAVYRERHHPAVVAPRFRSLLEEAAGGPPRGPAPKELAEC
jgi:glycosyltransferase involved in cell wall biosynthesis